MEATTFVIVVLAFWSFIATIILFQKNTELLEKLANLETRIAKLEARELQQVEVPVEKEPPPKAPAVPVDIERVPEVPHKTTITSAQTPEELTEPVPVEPQPSQPPHKEAPETVSSSYKVDDPNLTVDLEKLEFRSRIEKQFIDNWAGILGSIIMVMGAAFLSIYAALKMAPFYRFLMLTGFAGLLFTVFFVLRTRSKWLKLAQWLRSSGCAVFLFGCLGSGYIPGLKWIDSPVYALGLLLIGVLLNLVIGTISGNQLFTSFHSIISLTALAIAPQSQLTLAIAVSISLLQVFITYRGRWEYHLLVSITVFLAYHLYWAYSMHLFSISPIPPNLKLTGIAATAVLGIATAFVHYRELYGSRSFDGLPFIVHLLNWFYMAAGFYLYSTGSKWNTFVLAAASLAAFFLSRRAKTLAIRWLFITDTLIAQTLALLAVFTLQRWDLGGMAIAMALMVEVMIFLTMMLPEEEKSLQRIGVFLYHFSGIFLISGTLIIIVSRPLSHLHKDTGILALSMAIYTVYHIYLVRRKSDSFDSLRIYGIPNKFNKLESYSLGGIITGLLGLVLCALVYDFQWFPYVVAGVLTVLFLLCRRCGSGGLQIGMLLLTFGSFDFGWYHILYHLEGNPSQAALYGLPFLVIAIAGARTSFNEISGKYHKALWIYLFSIHMVICSQTVLDPLSIFATGTAWLVLAPVYLESARFISRRDPDELKEKGEPHRFL
ncbi:MAG: hypothetical protein GY940_02900, partial [bacterium]|nr:hypothetical protein [bacterium]